MLETYTVNNIVASVGLCCGSIFVLVLFLKFKNQQIFFKPVHFSQTSFIVILKVVYFYCNFCYIIL